MNTQKIVDEWRYVFQCELDSFLQFLIEHLVDFLRIQALQAGDNSQVFIAAIVVLRNPDRAMDLLIKV